jgi:hypothetical protein
MAFNTKLFRQTNNQKNKAIKGDKKKENTIRLYQEEKAEANSELSTQNFCNIQPNVNKTA